MVAAPGIDGRRPGQVERRPADGELVRRELAHQDAARRLAAEPSTAASAAAMLSISTFECAVVGRPATSMMSFKREGHAVQRAAQRPAADLALGPAPPPAPLGRERMKAW